MFFSVSIRSNQTPLQFVYVQYYKRFGGPVTGAPRHRDPRVPEILHRRMPRAYLPEHELGQRYDIFPLSAILSPAPICDDVSPVLAPQPSAEIAALEAAAAQAAAEQNKPKKKLEPRLVWNAPIIPTYNNCPVVNAGRRCNNEDCLWLHDGMSPIVWYNCFVLLFYLLCYRDMYYWQIKWPELIRQRRK